MIKQPLVSGHVSSVCLSKPLQGGLGNEEALWLEGISPKQRQITHFSCSSPSAMDMCQKPTSVTVSQGSLQIQQGTGAACLVTCYLYHVLESCVRSLTALLRKLPGGSFTSWNAASIPSAEADDPQWAGNELNGSPTETMLLFNNQVKMMVWIMFGCKPTAGEGWQMTLTFPLEKVF